MTDIRCPMCGTSNPAGAATCRKCKARLTSTSSGTPAPDAAASPAGSGSSPFGGADWLSSLRPEEDAPAGPSPFEDPANSDSGASEGDLPDWLARIRERSREEDGAISPLTNPLDRLKGQDEVPANNGIPDWLQSLGGADDSNSSPEAANNSWLSSFGTEDEPPASAVTPPAPAPSSPTVPAEEIPDWLKSLDGGGTDQDIPSGAASFGGGASGVQAEKPDGSTDWFNQLSSPDLPDPVSNPPAATPAAPELNDDVPDWMAGAASAAFGSAEPEVWKPEPTGRSEPKAPSVPAAPSSEKKPPAFSDDLPGWLDEDSSLAQPVQDPPPPAPSQPAPAQPKVEPPAVPPTAVPPAAKLSDVELPDWLHFGSESSAPAGSSASAPIAPLAGGGENLDWLTSLPEEESAVTDQKPASAFVGAAPFGDGADLASHDQNLPNWLSTVAPENPPPSAPPSTSTPAFIVENEADLSTNQPVTGHPFSSEDIPDWLVESEKDKEPEPPKATFKPVSETNAEPAPAVQPDNLAPAQLPGWLQAMRPVEAVAPNNASKVDNNRIESAGPLAGLQGILPSEDLSRRYRKPAIYSVKLHISEKQRTFAAQMEQLLSDESKPQEIKPDAAWSPQWIVRVVLAVILILVIIFSAPMTTSVPKPTAETITNANTIAALPLSAPVLVAVEYDPGFAGEMRMASMGVIERLIGRNMRLALVSTVPGGPVLGEELLSRAQEDIKSRHLPGETYSFETQTANLGFLPGGVTSLAEFAKLPQQAASNGLKGKQDSNPWSQPALAGVDGIQKFAAVLVLTDSGDTGRAWVEQVQPQLGSTPLFIISSAQAAPMLAPYAASGQVKVLLSGISGGTAYQQVVQGGVSDPTALGGFQGSQFLGMAFISIGLLMGLMTSALRKRKA